MCFVTVTVGLFKGESEGPVDSACSSSSDDEDAELDASGESEKRGRLHFMSMLLETKTSSLSRVAELGIKETYSRLYSVTKLPTVRLLVLVLLTYRLPTALSDNAKFLKALDYGLDKATVAMLAPTLILPLGILVPILATKMWKGAPLQQFLFGYKMRVTVVALVDVVMLVLLKSFKDSHPVLLWTALISSTALQTIASSMQFNAQMTFFASRVDRNIGGSYMTLLNTFANLGGTWPASPVLYLLGRLSNPAFDAYIPMQLLLSFLGLCWLGAMGKRVTWLGNTKEGDWSTGGAGKVKVEVDLENGTRVRGKRARSRSASRKIK